MTLRALSIAASGGRALLRQIDTIASNLANVNSIGYHRSRVNFTDLMMQGSSSSGVRYQSTDMLFDPGKLQATQRELDLAIEGDGFLRVVLPDQSAAFTRAGNLSLDARGNLVTPDGYLIDPPINVPSTISKIVIDPTGLVQGFDAQSPEALQPLGQLEVTRFANPSGLQQVGSGLYRATPSAGERLDGQPGRGLGVIRQGHLEQSNVDAIRELVDLIQAQRAFELNSRTIQAADEILQNVNNLRRKS
jgi:flagellar basal-body rod protein FlgG